MKRFYDCHLELGDRIIVIALGTSIENKAESFIKGKQSFIYIYISTANL